MKKLLYILTVAALPLFSFAQQNVEFEKKNFPDRKDELKEAIKEIREGDAIWDMKMPNIYPVAIPHYLKAQNFNPNNALLNFRIGVAYLQTHEKAKAYDYITKAYALNPAVDKQIRYYTGWVHHLRSEWDKAITEYQGYAATVGKDKEEVAKVTKRIEECRTGIELSKNPVRVFVDNVGPEINSSYSDYSPVITADQSIMMFTSRRPGGVSAGLSEEDNLPYEDIWMSTRNGKKWTQSRNIGTPVNLELHNAAICLSPDGSKLITYDGAKQGGDLFISELMGAMWTKPEPLGKKINTDGHEASASFSYDAKILYFVSSDRKDGLGGHDIYYSNINEKGKFEHAENIGPPINTSYDEDGVYMMPDGKTMYYSSKGPGSIGGYDIFKTTLENGKWTQPVNMGIPINTPDDDVFFVMAANGRHAFYASASGKGYGGQDIYRLTILGPEKQPLLNMEDQLLAMAAHPISNLKTEAAVESKGPKMALLKGVITDEKTKQVLEASIDLIDNEKNVLLATFKSNSTTGRYLVTLPAGHNYGIAVKKDGYLFHSENFIIDQNADYIEYNKDVALKKVEVGSVIVLRNIFFDFDKATIKPESANELDRLIKLLTENPTIKIELGSHTDSKGSDEYNMKLSDNRSKSVVEYLIAHGIPADRLTSKGYGETKPIDTNDTDEGRQNNRRTEFKITSK
jgi:outer membrane protein OmpA-like peptidoglycan-associated protein/tetratricopeptide (TPR) repeat protein